MKIKDDSNNVLETYAYGASRNRLKNENATQRTYYAWGGNSPLVEYTEATASTTPAYSKSYVYAGSRLLSTSTKKTSTTQEVSIHHPDRLGTGAISTPSKSTYEHNSALPFGMALAGETGTSDQPFTSYDRFNAVAAACTAFGHRLSFPIVTIELFRKDLTRAIVRIPLCGDNRRTS